MSFSILNSSGNKVRVGLVGLGRRGLATLRRFSLIAQAEVVALCDRIPEAIDAAVNILPPSSPRPRLYVDWHDLVESKCIDLVYVCTDWGTHAPIAIAAMRAGHDVAVEVPLAVTIEQCRKIVAVSNATGRLCTMTENCCYDPFNLAQLSMVERGLLGTITHLEGAYIHDLRHELEGSRSWYVEMGRANGANPYPTHAIGPICQLIAAADPGAETPDRPVALMSLSSSITPDGPNTTLVRTARGRSIMLQYDISTPRPYSRIQMVCGSAGYSAKYPEMIIQADSINGGQPLKGEKLQEWLDREAHPWVKEYEPDARRLGVDNMMNYIMDRRLFDNILNCRPPDISVADAALWSAFAPLTSMSVKGGGIEVPIPDFHTHL